MSERAETPTVCRGCGQPLEFAAPGDTRTDAAGPGVTVGAKAYCVNPECDLSEGEGVSPEDQWLNAPGTEGGANGGA
ncbi:hypothetical protein [Nocardioides xinjiangensis]|uniref:hypothetical protein n=1 Tax=Nocardioides xinjiangensis TaxID=2817376 RepID=UPI001B31656D|nr:hypothetical protein [Nocardioides sp. SYSU D00514]